MISYEQALGIIEATAQPLPVINLPLQNATGTVAATGVLCPGAVPPFDNSAMDGFAVRADGTAGASAAAPAELRVLGMITAGEANSRRPFQPGTAWEIMTGAPMPVGYDSVIPVEQVTVLRDAAGKPVGIRLHESLQSGSNLRRAGEDFAAGAVLLRAGQLIQAHQIMGLAATGTGTLACRPLPRVAVITTGNELTHPDTQLQPGKIHDSNGPYLEAAIGAMGGAGTGVYRIGDSADELISRVQSLPDVDIILTTGGVSAGRMDFVPRALEQLGADILFHRVAIRPGKPILFARLPNGTLVFGLPGNPIAVAVGLRFFVVPALRRLRGLTIETYATARLVDNHHKKPGLRFFAKAHATTDADGMLRVEILPGQESFKISPLMQANCWLIAGADQASLPADSPQTIAFLYPELPVWQSATPQPIDLDLFAANRATDYIFPGDSGTGTNQK